MKTLKNGKVVDNCETVIEEMLGIVRDMYGVTVNEEKPRKQLKLLENKISILVAKIESLIDEFDKTSLLLDKMKDQTAAQHKRDDENFRYINYLEAEIKRLAIQMSRMNERIEEY